MEMTRDAIKLIQDTAVQATTPAVKEIPGNDRKVIVSHCGDWQFEDIPPPRRNHQAYDLDTLVEMSAGAANPAFYLSPEKVVLVFDNGDRRDKATMELYGTDAWRRLYGLHDGETFDQKELIRFMRTKLGCGSELVDKFRKLDFSLLESGARNLQRGKESLGKAVEAKVQGVEEIPESFNVSCAIFANPSEKGSVATVRVSVDIDPRSQQFFLWTDRAAMDLATAIWIEHIHERLVAVVGEGAPVYRASL